MTVLRLAPDHHFPEDHHLLLLEDIVALEVLNAETSGCQLALARRTGDVVHLHQQLENQNDPRAEIPEILLVDLHLLFILIVYVSHKINYANHGPGLPQHGNAHLYHSLSIETKNQQRQLLKNDLLLVL